MNNDERKPRLHVHLGGLVILIIIVLILFKVDIKSKIDSPQFQKNYTYLEGKIKIFWQNYIIAPLKAKTGDLFVDFTSKELKKIQDNFNKNVLEVEDVDEIMN